jgi:hypothetical protein
MGRRKSIERKAGRNGLFLCNSKKEMDLMEQRNSFSSILNTPLIHAVCGLQFWCLNPSARCPPPPIFLTLSSICQSLGVASLTLFETTGLFSSMT